MTIKDADSTRLTLREFIKAFEAGAFRSPDVMTQIRAGWFDWFCDDGKLARKTEELGKKVVQLAESRLIDQDRNYVFFKNNCPAYGRLYDSFSICDVENGDVLYWVSPRLGYDAPAMKGKASVHSFVGNEQEVLGTWRDVKAFFEV